MPNIVYGVNHKQFDFEKENIFSAASCTTNAIAPILYVINKSKKLLKDILKQYTLIQMTKIYLIICIVKTGEEGQQQSIWL